jgi:hypothetical protein
VLTTFAFVRIRLKTLAEVGLQRTNLHETFQVPITVLTISILPIPILTNELKNMILPPQQPTHTVLCRYYQPDLLTDVLMKAEPGQPAILPVPIEDIMY